MYKISRYVSFIEKNEAYALYCNFNLYFFKGITYKWFKMILNNEDLSVIDSTFIDYLISKEIIYKEDITYV